MENGELIMTSPCTLRERRELRGKRMEAPRAGFF